MIFGDCDALEMNDVNASFTSCRAKKKEKKEKKKEKKRKEERGKTIFLFRSKLWRQTGPSEARPTMDLLLKFSKFTTLSSKWRAPTLKKSVSTFSISTIFNKLPFNLNSFKTESDTFIS